jgi:hypothetical protein
MLLKTGYATVGGIIATLAIGVGAGRAQDARPPTVTAEDGPGESSQAPLDPRIDAILSRLEAQKVGDLTADLKWISAYAGGVEEEGESQTKHGTIRYKSLKPVARFAIHFYEKLDDRKHKLDDLHLFDGCWYTEVQHKTRQVTRYEVRKPEDPVDPYKVGEGIFPMPFGQQKAEVLAEFDIAYRERKPDDPKDTDHLVLRPRPGTRLERLYATLDIWVASEGALAGLPIQVKAGKKDGTGKLNQVITILFSNARLNAGVSENDFEFKTPPGYAEEKHPLNGGGPIENGGGGNKP